MQDLVHDGAQVVAVERCRPGQHFVEDPAQRENVRSAIRGLARHLLRRHVFGRAEDGAELRARTRRNLGNPEIHDFDVAAGRDHDVCRLDVAMHHVILVCVIQRARDAGHDSADHLHRQHHAGIEHFAQRFAFDVFHRDIGHVAGLAHIVDGDDIGMAQAAGGLGLAVKARLELGAFLFREVEVDRLDGDRTLDQRVSRLVDGPHRALSKHGHHFITTDFSCLAGHAVGWPGGLPWGNS